MSIKKNIGKNTLGDGKKMQVDLRTYNRSTHDLSFAWRNTQGVGTLVPCCKLLALPGDTADIEIDAKVLTHPTVGPLFGSYKLQVDFFVAPIRLYNALLHNNALNIGLDMSKVKLPQVRLQCNANTSPKKDYIYNSVHPSSILAYLGVRGTKYTNASSTEDFNAVPLLAYLDIFKNYYANKQEENYYFISNPVLNSTVYENNFTYSKNGYGNYAVGGNLILQIQTPNTLQQLYYNWEGVNGYPDISMTYSEFYELFRPSSSGNLYTFTPVGGTGTVIELKYQGKLYEGVFKSVSAYIEPTIMEAPLEELDELRNDILAANTTTQLIVNQIADTAKYLTEIFKSSSNVPSMATSSNGLILKTHQSDVFTNWINTEWVDGENGISAITAIDTSGDSFTIDSLNLAKKVYDMLNRIAVSGGSYRDWIETVYTSDYTIHAETPIYEGGMSDEIVFQEVVSNSATEEEPLGTLAGRGTLAGNRKGGKLHIKINEPAYIIGICSITPRVDYCQGNDWDMYLETMNDLHKPQLDGIGYQDVLTQNAAFWKSRSGESIGKTVAWINYMTNFNKTYGNFAIEGNEAFMVLNRYFDPEEGNYASGKVNTSSYINPNDYNYTFAETNVDTQNFWVQLGFGIKMRRVMSAKQIPNL